MEADLLRQEAEKKCKGGFFAIFKGGGRLDEASELFVKAGNQYKLKNQWTAAGECFERAADLQHQMGDYIQEAQYLVECGNVHRKVSVAEARSHYMAASKIYTDGGRFAQAGKLMKALAEEYEKMGEFDEAIVMYEKAMEYFSLDEYSKSLTSQCKVKYAELLASKKDELDQAIAIFEAEATAALGSPLLQFGAKEFFFKAAILYMARGRSDIAMQKCEEFEKIDPRFEQSREGKLLRGLCAAVEADKVDEFVDLLAEYDRITRLDPWKVTFLNRVKGRLTPSQNPDQPDEMHIPDVPVLQDSTESKRGNVVFDLT